MTRTWEQDAAVPVRSHADWSRLYSEANRLHVAIYDRARAGDANAARLEERVCRRRDRRFTAALQAGRDEYRSRRGRHV